jgi:phosphatidylserine/phosphatidylglycerophosphate/cardiolipin synthase-like enzyme
VLCQTPVSRLSAPGRGEHRPSPRGAVARSPQGYAADPVSRRWGHGGLRRDTTIVFPARNDSWIVGAASRSYYADLLSAGVKIYEYEGGLPHTKSLTLDGTTSLPRSGPCSEGRGEEATLLQPLETLFI